MTEETKLLRQLVRGMMALAEAREGRIEQLEAELEQQRARADEPPDLDAAIGQCRAAVRVPDAEGAIVAVFAEAAEAHSWARPQFKKYAVEEIA